MKLLFVCLGNICRSPMAEGIMKSLCEKHYLQWEIASASTNTYHTGEAPHYLSQNICQHNGINIKNQRAQRISKEHAAHYDIIYVMARDVQQEVKQILGMAYNGEKVKLFLNELYPDSNKDVPDP